MEPVLAPLGFDWRIGTALIGAFAAKEVFVAQMGIVFAVEDTGETSQALRERLRAQLHAPGRLLRHALLPDRHAVHVHRRRHQAGER